MWTNIKKGHVDSKLLTLKNSYISFVEKHKGSITNIFKADVDSFAF